jgi:hypothetical protein
VSIIRISDIASQGPFAIRRALAQQWAKTAADTYPLVLLSYADLIELSDATITLLASTLPSSYGVVVQEAYDSSAAESPANASTTSPALASNTSMSALTTSTTIGSMLKEDPPAPTAEEQPVSRLRFLSARRGSWRERKRATGSSSSLHDQQSFNSSGPGTAVSFSNDSPARKDPDMHVQQTEQVSLSLPSSLSLSVCLIRVSP